MCTHSASELCSGTDTEGLAQTENMQESRLIDLLFSLLIKHEKFTFISDVMRLPDSSS